LLSLNNVNKLGHRLTHKLSAAQVGTEDTTRTTH
jgi:hypothetical protein